MADFEYKTIIKEQHLDMLGHVNNAAYLTLLEEARWQFITDNGHGLGQIMKTQQSPVVLEVHLKFQKELRNREAIKIRSTMMGWRGKIGHIHQEIIKENGELACKAKLTIGFFDLKTRSLIPINKEFSQALGLD